MPKNKKPTLTEIQRATKEKERRAKQLKKTIDSSWASKVPGSHVGRLKATEKMLPGQTKRNARHKLAAEFDRYNRKNLKKR